MNNEEMRNKDRNSGPDIRQRMPSHRSRRPAPERVPAQGNRIRRPAPERIPAQGSRSRTSERSPGNVRTIRTAETGRPRQAEQKYRRRETDHLGTPVRVKRPGKEPEKIAETPAQGEAEARKRPEVPAAAEMSMAKPPAAEPLATEPVTEIFSVTESSEEPEIGTISVTEPAAAKQPSEEPEIEMISVAEPAAAKQPSEEPEIEMISVTESAAAEPATEILSVTEPAEEEPETKAPAAAEEPAAEKSAEEEGKQESLREDGKEEAAEGSGPAPKPEKKKRKRLNRYQQIAILLLTVFLIIVLLVALFVLPARLKNKQEPGFMDQIRSQEIKENDVAALDAFFHMYYLALASGNTTQLESMFDDPSKADITTEISTIVDQYDNLRVYVTRGIEEEDIVAFVYNEIHFGNIDAVAPSVDSFYLTYDTEKAELKIRTDMYTDPDILKYMNLVSYREPIRTVLSDANEVLGQKLAENKDLNNLYILMQAIMTGGEVPQETDKDKKPEQKEEAEQAEKEAATEAATEATED